MFSWLHRHRHATRFRAEFFKICGEKIQKENMTFQLNVGQKGTLRVVAVDSATPPNTYPLPTDLSASSSNSSIVSVAPDPTTAGDFTVTALAAGSEDITVAGTNGAGVTIQTPFTFQDTAVPPPAATGFTGVLINVGPA
jgi:uncharacterized protein YjdB